MKCWVLSILIVFFAGGKTYAQAQDEVREALLGNDPKTTLTTGIGQVVQPVGIPVVQPLTGTPLAAPPAPLPPPTTTTKKGDKPTEFKYKVIYDYYEKDAAKNKFEPGGEITQKKVKDQNTLRKEALKQLILSNELAGGDETVQEKSLAITIPEKNAKPKKIRVPYSDPPQVKKIPYSF